MNPHTSWADLLPGPGVLPATPAVTLSELRLSVAFDGLVCPLCAAFQSAHRQAGDESPLVFCATGRMTLHRHTRRLLL
ncbi:MAG: hypothetical protein GX130_06130 [Candidatus Hydrogenedens sp.]|nr:hypothetical protein [Candidatus Hydrogenedens sp.]